GVVGVAVGVGGVGVCVSGEELVSASNACHESFVPNVCGDGFGFPCPFAVDDDGAATDRGLGLGTGSAMLSSGECFPCGVSADTGDPLVPGARQVVLLLIGQVSDLRGGEGLPVAFGDLGGHRRASFAAVRAARMIRTA